MDDRSLQILIALAWLGMATKDQLRRLCCPDVSLKTVERTLSGLESQGPSLILTRKRATRTSEGTRRLPTVYLLSEAANELLLRRDDYPRRTANGQYPIKAGGPRADHLVDHDLQVVEAAIGLIVAARRRTLSGVFLARELRLTTGAGALIPDAIILLQFGGALSDSAVPWTKVPSAQASLQAFAIESDRATEPQSTIASKAGLYANLLRAESRQRWAERFHCLPPTPLWIANSPERAETLNQIWLQAWPHGSWMVSDIGRVAEGKATLVSEGQARKIWLFGSPAGAAGDRVVTPPASSQPDLATTSAQAAPPTTLSPRPNPSATVVQAAQPEQAAPSLPNTPQPALGAASPIPPGLAPTQPAIKPGAGAPVIPAPALAPVMASTPKNAVSVRPPRKLPKLHLPPLGPLPAFPRWLVPRAYRAPLTNILCCLGLALWLPLWAALTLAAQILKGLLTFDTLLAEEFGRARALLAWLFIVGLVAGWVAVLASWHRAAREAALPHVWATYGPAPVVPTTTVEQGWLPCVPALVTADRVNIRIAPGLSSEPGPRQLFTGEHVEVCGSSITVDEHRWRLVRTANGGGGYVSDQYLDAATPRRLQELIRAGRIEE